MEKILLFIDRFSFKQLFSIALVFGLLVTMPATLYLSQKEKRIGSKAVSPNINPTLIMYGPIPGQEPKILGIKPYLGKSGDEVVVWGENFGKKPFGGMIYLGKIKIDQVISWEEGEIRFIIPVNAISSNFSLNVGSWNVVYDKSLNVYSQATQVKISLQDNQLKIINVVGMKKIQIWSSLDTKPTTVELNVVFTGGEFLVPGKFEKIQWITLYDDKGQIISFIQNPTEIR